MLAAAYQRGAHLQDACTFYELLKDTTEVWHSDRFSKAWKGTHTHTHTHTRPVHAGAQQAVLYIDQKLLVVNDEAYRDLSLLDQLQKDFQVGPGEWPWLHQQRHGFNFFPNARRWPSSSLALKSRCCSSRTGPRP